MKVEEQQKIVAEVLTAVKRLIDSEAIVAGGAPRNWKYGELANDIDLYMRSNCINTTSRFLHQLKHCLGLNPEGKLETYQEVEIGDYTFGVDLEISKLVGVVYKDVKFQFILMNPNQQYTNFKKQIVEHMDIGLNRIYCDWYSKMDVGAYNETKEHKEDFENNKLTLYTNCMTASQLKHCMEHHLPKMKQYYPNYTLDIK